MASMTMSYIFRYVQLSVTVSCRTASNMDIFSVAYQYCNHSMAHAWANEKLKVLRSRMGLTINDPLILIKYINYLLSLYALFVQWFPNCCQRTYARQCRQFWDSQHLFEKVFNDLAERFPNMYKDHSLVLLHVFKSWPIGIVPNKHSALGHV